MLLNFGLNAGESGFFFSKYECYAIYAIVNALVFFIIPIIALVLFYLRLFFIKLAPKKIQIY